MSLTITTDKKTYVTGENIRISGTIPNKDESDIILMLINPDNEIALIKQLLPNESREFGISIMVGTQPVMVKSGEYVARVQYQGEKLETTISINVN